jgi:uncharacterized protein YcfJ
MVKPQHNSLYTMVVAALLSATLLPQTAAAESFTDWATVTRVEPVERTYTVRRPVEKCWMETVRVERPRASDGSITNELIGGILGGVVGNQFGGGSGKDAMTIAGAALGASIANDQEKLRAGQDSGGSHYREVERCETVYETEEKRERTGYQVSYRYNGHTFTTKMQHRPNDSIRVRVMVSPQ